MTDKATRDIFQHMDFDTKQLVQLWEDIQALSVDHPSLWNYKIAKELDLTEYEWGEGYLLKRILPELRNTLRDENIISIETQQPDGSTNERQVWVIDE